jgi:phage anti-repressor protein/predicted GIY-YIG superfamily endonuclease
MSDIRAFLKKYSAIPNSFIDDFHRVYNRTSQEDFIIDLDIVSKWLSVRKSTIKKTLVESYQKGTDYVENIVPNGKSAGRNTHKIMLTADCFKFLCMRSRTAKSQLVRTYYVELEKLIEKYSADFTEKLQERIRQLENNQKPQGASARTKGVIYVVKVSDDKASVFKLGRSKDFKKRLQAHNSARMDDVDVIYVFETDMIEEVERCCKAMLVKKQYRKIKEVYQVDIDIIKSVINGCAELALKTQYKMSKPSKMTGGYFMVFDKDAMDM